VILYALLAGALPFDHVDMKRLLAKVSIGSYEMPEGFPVDAKDLISRMLVVDPNKRIKVGFGWSGLRTSYG
jgi:serine/threonine-protein kinase HSL1 (negative regulator of Swe1 kinase)